MSREKLKRIAVVTPFFPNQAEPQRGRPTYQLVCKLATFADVNVVCPLPRYPNWLQPRSFEYKRPSLEYNLPGIRVQYVEFPAVPLLTRLVGGMFCARYLLNCIRSLSPDLILNYWLYPQGYAAVEVGRRLGIPVVVGSIGSDLNAIADPVTRFFTKLTLQRANMVITKGDQLRRAAIALGADPSKVRTVLNGCDTECFQVLDRAKARAELSIGLGGKLIVYVGRLELTKGLLELLAAFAALRRRNRQVRLALIGGGRSRAALVERAHLLRVAEHVLFIPPQTPSEVSCWLAASDLLVLPSYFEGCPNVVLEAISCGRPVVATDVGGIPEIVDERCALLIPPRDVKALIGALEIALDREWDERTITKCFQRNWEDVARESYHICLSSLAGQPACTPSQTVSAEGV